MVVSCSPVAPDMNPANNVETTSAGTIDKKLLDADAVEYYKDIAVLAEWYVDHPATLATAISNNETHAHTDSAYNAFVGELQEMDLRDENDKHFSFFALSDSERHVFLRDYVKLQAKVLDDKFKLAGTDAANDHTQSTNLLVDQVVKTSAYSDAFNFDAEAAKITVANPYEIINEKLTHNQSPVLPTTSGNTGLGLAEEDFWRIVANSNWLSAATVKYQPLCFNNTPQKFVDKIRSNVSKGLVLVSLPAGTVTGSPLAFNGFMYDVGHVAIISEDAGKIPNTINDDFSFTIGTNSDYGMHHEKIKADWTKKHGMAYLMKPVRIVYSKKWGIILNPWSSHAKDVNNSDTYQRITEVLGKPYCSMSQLLTAKFNPPNKFICSTSAWWAILVAHHIDIGDMYKPTIFPAGVFLSSNMRVVAQTW